MAIVILRKKPATWHRLARQTLDYVVALAVAALCSYWIVRGPW